MPTYLPAFMSHAHLDNDRCDPYHLALSQRGVACYYDRDQPQAGASLSLALQNELERARALVVMVTPAMLGSFWVEQEIDMFFALMARDRTRKLIPVRIAACELPTRLAARWWLDATTEPFAAIIEKLTR
ncbi:MAG TPA: toll/interleukin-1 receptor domain-containing protein, partial [Ktedonobacterales bacterium]